MTREWKDLTEDEQALAREYHNSKRKMRWLVYLFNGLPLPMSADEDEDAIIPPPPPPPPDDKP